MTPIYFYVLLFSSIVPILFSIFVTDFIKSWKYFIISTSVVALIFLIWDAIFTQLGIWGFNAQYCLGINMLQMPIEEWLFFFIIPFCSLFLHFALLYKFPKFTLNAQQTKVVSYILMSISLFFVLMHFNKAYTAVSFLFLLITLIIGIKYQKETLQNFLLSFTIILIPFFLVNGILTGAFTPEPVVWYNNLENLGIRLFTIPVEDIGYGFTMLFGNLMIFEWLKKQNSKSTSTM